MDNAIIKLSKINKLLDELEELSSPSSASKFKQWDLFHRESALIIESLFGRNNKYTLDWDEIEIPEEPDIEDDKGFLTYIHKQRIMKENMENQLNIIRKKIEISSNKKVTKPIIQNKVFIVHGKDHEPLEELKSILQEVNIQPLILEELPCGSKTIIEKLEMYSKVDFAFVLLTPDDKGSTYLGQENGLDSFEKLNFRARQNAILEFGYFIGKLGRKKVCYLKKRSVEIPSDMNGISYIEFRTTLKEVKQKIIDELLKAKVV